eukprot:6924-Heterococcus_DN1.PRE.1
MSEIPAAHLVAQQRIVDRVATSSSSAPLKLCKSLLPCCLRPAYQLAGALLLCCSDLYHAGDARALQSATAAESYFALRWRVHVQVPVTATLTADEQRIFAPEQLVLNN